MLIGLDLDGVCADFDAGIRSAYWLGFQETIPESTYWDSILDNIHFETWDEIYEWLRSLDDFWAGLPHLGGARTGVESLLRQGHQIVVITHRPEWATEQTQRWVSWFWPGGYEYPDIVLTRHKQTVAFDALIDDGPHNVGPVVSTGREIVLFDQPWNSQVEPTDLVRRARGWGEVIELCTPPTLIGLMGYAQVGKDTTAGVLAESGFERIAFADALKQMLLSLDPIVTDGSEPQRRVSSVVESEGWEGAKRIPEIRRLLQRLGTEAGRQVLGDGIWVDTAFQNVRHGGKFVITDVRFPNEVAAVRKWGGKLWRVTRDGYGPVNGHASETAVDHVDPDVVISNNADIDALWIEVDKALRGE